LLAESLTFQKFKYPHLKICPTEEKIFTLTLTNKIRKDKKAILFSRHLTLTLLNGHLLRIPTPKMLLSSKTFLKCQKKSWTRMNGRKISTSMNKETMTLYKGTSITTLTTILKKSTHPKINYSLYKKLLYLNLLKLILTLISEKKKKKITFIIKINK
jgi:hypothetical protein